MLKILSDGFAEIPIFSQKPARNLGFSKNAIIIIGNSNIDKTINANL